MGPTNQCPSLLCLAKGLRMWRKSRSLLYIGRYLSITDQTLVSLFIASDVFSTIVSTAHFHSVPYFILSVGAADSILSDVVNNKLSVLLTVGPKRTLAASHAAPWWVTVSRPTGRTDGRQTVALCFLLEAACVTTYGNLYVFLSQCICMTCCSVNVKIMVTESKMRNYV